jgi:hypothetical protein
MTRRPASQALLSERTSPLKRCRFDAYEIVIFDWHCCVAPGGGEEAGLSLGVAPGVGEFWGVVVAGAGASGGSLAEGVGEGVPEPDGEGVALPVGIGNVGIGRGVPVLVLVGEGDDSPPVHSVPAARAGPAWRPSNGAVLSIKATTTPLATALPITARDFGISLLLGRIGTLLRSARSSTPTQIRLSGHP